MSVASGAEWVVMGLVVPLWVLAGLLDWWCHRRTAIERTAGMPENVFHWILFAEAGVALLAVALLEVNAAVLLLVFAAFVAHEVTTFIELRYVVRLREVRPLEQMVHSFMELLPLVILALIAAMQWDQVVALFDRGAPDLTLQLKARPWPPGYLAGMGVAVLLLNVLPLGEEGLRCRRAKRQP